MASLRCVLEQDIVLVQPRKTRPTERLLTGTKRIKSNKHVSKQSRPYQVALTRADRSVSALFEKVFKSISESRAKIWRH